MLRLLFKLMPSILLRDLFIVVFILWLGTDITIERNICKIERRSIKTSLILVEGLRKLITRLKRGHTKLEDLLA